MPASVGLTGSPVAEIRSALDVVALDATLLAAWERVLTYGMARCRIRMARTPDLTGTNRLFDLRVNHGVIVVLTVVVALAAELRRRQNVQRTQTAARLAQQADIALSGAT